jgi:hypothetical protein
MSESAVDPLVVGPAPVGPWTRAERGPRGTRLVEADPPEHGTLAPGGALTVRALASRSVHTVEAVADGRLALALGSGAAFSIRVPEMAVVHTRRPPGLDRIQGAGVANAGLLHGDEGWRMVVLPSLGDIATDLGDGPLALRSDARMLAVVLDGGVEEIDLSTGDTARRHDVVPAAMDYAGDGSLLVGSGAAVTAPGAPSADGSPIVALTCATRAWTALARHADGALSVWALEEGGPVKRAELAPPREGELSIGLSPDGEQAVVATPFGEPAGLTVLRTADGAMIRRIEGARTGALLADGEMIVGSEWGLAFMRPAEEDM